MTVTNVEKDREALTMTITAEFAAPLERVWRLWADPRLLERWWGPPTYPATFVEHDLRPGGRVTYRMTGPEGDTHGGWWRVLAVEAQQLLEVEDGFANPDGSENTDLPTVKIRTTFHDIGGLTRVVIVSTFVSLEAMDELISMGVEEGTMAAMGQMDALLAD